MLYRISQNQIFNLNSNVKWPRYDVVDLLKDDAHKAEWANSFYYCEVTGDRRVGYCDYDHNKFWIVIRKCSRRWNMRLENYCRLWHDRLSLIVLNSAGKQLQGKLVMKK